MNSGTMTRDSDESHIWSGQSLFSPEPRAKNAFQPSTLGILIYSLRQKLLHMNRRALELMDHLGQSEISTVNNIPSESVRILQILIQETLGRCREINIWEPFEFKCVVFEAGRKILLRGFGLADRHSYDDSRIVIILEEVGSRQEHKAQQAPAQVYPSESRNSNVEELAS
jgi:hypothetical protein